MMFTQPCRSTCSTMVTRNNGIAMLQQHQERHLYQSLMKFVKNSNTTNAAKAFTTTTTVGGTIVLLASYTNAATTRATTNQLIQKQQCYIISKQQQQPSLLLSSLLNQYGNRTMTTTTSSTIMTPITTLRNQMMNSTAAVPFQQRCASTTSAAGTVATTTTSSSTGAITSATTTAASNATTKATTTKTNLSFMEWYEGHLSRSPIITKMITGSFLWGLGDMVAQIIPQISYGNSSDDSNSSSSTTAVHSFTYDYIRTGRAVLFGFVIHAPLSHLHYNFLEYITVQMKFTGYSIPLFKAFMEQFVYWSWISNSIYFAAMGAMQGLNMEQIIQRIYDVLWETQVAQWTFWIPIQLINFQYTPVRHQLNVVLVTSIVWTALLSMWYPPIQKKNDDDEKK